MYNSEIFFWLAKLAILQCYFSNDSVENLKSASLTVTQINDNLSIKLGNEALNIENSSMATVVFLYFSIVNFQYELNPGNSYKSHANLN